MDDGNGAVRVVKDTVADRAQECAADAAAPATPDDQEVRDLRGVDKGVDGVGSTVRSGSWIDAKAKA